MKRSALLSAALAAVGLLAAAPGATASACSEARGDAEVLVKSREAVVFQPQSGVVYGCYSSVGTAYELEDFYEVLFPRLSGRYVAFVIRIEEFMQPINYQVKVFDLVTGRLQRKVFTEYVPKVIVKRNASIAWAEAVKGAAPGYEVHRISVEDDRGDVLLDEGTGIRPRSLSFRDGRRFVAWRHDGELRRARLR